MNNKVKIINAHKIPMLTIGILNETFHVQVHPNDHYTHATIDEDGDLKIHQDKPILDDRLGLWNSASIRYITNVEFEGNWKDSLVEFKQNI